MKKKILKAILVAAFALIAGFNVYNAQQLDDASGCLILDNIEALASSREMINPECPNGCLSNGDKCHCYHDYAGYREAPW